MQSLVDPLPAADLTGELIALVRQIPRGRVATCGALAVALGDVRAALWVAQLLLHHQHGDRLPCHRVVRANGRLGGHVSGDAAIKQTLLEAEGVPVREGIVDLQRYNFDKFRCPRPLEVLRRQQDELLAKVELTAWRHLPERVAGVDVSYTRQGDAVAAYVLVDARSRELLWSTTMTLPVEFPYIPTYLSYRELPALLAVVEAARAAGQLAELAMVDGTGILHPRRLGIATHLGLVAGLPTIGVTKTLLCGQVAGEPRFQRPAPIVLGGQCVGAALRPTAASKRLLYVSPGRRIDADSAQRGVERHLSGRRLPDPIYWADRLSRKAAVQRAVSSESREAESPA